MGAFCGSVGGTVSDHGQLQQDGEATRLGRPYGSLAHSEPHFRCPDQHIGPSATRDYRRAGLRVAARRRLARYKSRDPTKTSEQLPGHDCDIREQRARDLYVPSFTLSLTMAPCLRFRRASPMKAQAAYHDSGQHSKAFCWALGKLHLAEIWRVSLGKEVRHVNKLLMLGIDAANRANECHCPQLDAETPLTSGCVPLISFTDGNSSIGSTR